MKKIIILLGFIITLIYPCHELYAYSNYSIKIIYIDDQRKNQLDHLNIMKKVNSDYDVSELVNRKIKGYQQIKVTGDALKGKLNEDKVIKVYYQLSRACFVIKQINQNHQPIKGVNMVLYKQEKNQEKLIEMSHQEANYTFTSLKDGQYLLYENKTPQGYQIQKVKKLKIKEGKVYYHNKPIQQLTLKHKQKKHQENKQALYYYLVITLFFIIVLLLVRSYYKNKHVK